MEAPEGTHLFPLSPTTRRRHRGRGGVLDNMTASTITNNPSFLATTPDHDSDVCMLTPSPDEMVIQARGRRSTPLIFSPDVHLTPYRGKRATSGRLLLLPTRSSPRKRLTLTDSPPSPVKRSPSPRNSGWSQLMEKKPELAEDIRQIMPSPDLAPCEERLNYLKRNVYKALPNTRLESKTDSMAYNRVLLEANQWPALLDYSLMAWAYVRTTPVWDNPPHNNIRKQCFKSLSANCMHSLKRGEWSDEVYLDIKNKMIPLKQDSEEIITCLKYIDQLYNM
ncbi:unnamed protein product [Lepeophtheirus salmonis]|uniref:(salmon louse) hypothetical protein n=1 Tax=Lepeophtheirus salmonis TaxID=72036 RepID=A0A7R8CNY5_LEPSM|nr:unnamed protein product [Lepeophtheirus salmonis]CAF2880879.1 unnamed protein product [Lepeophtheirus salmonis]